MQYPGRAAWSIIPSMRFTRLELQNWRNFKKVDVPLGDRVFVFGANASGKSNGEVLLLQRSDADNERDEARLSQTHIE